MPAVATIRYPDGMGPAPHADDAGAWAGQAADVPAQWFAHFSWLHGVRHTQRVHIHAQRLVRELRWPQADAGIALSAALWHDIGRVNDGWDPQHGALGAARVVELGLHESLPEADAQLALFAIRYHCRGDGHGALRADALDRVRLGGGAYEVDSTALRHECTRAMVGFAEELLSVMP